MAKTPRKLKRARARRSRRRRPQTAGWARPPQLERVRVPGMRQVASRQSAL